jgi:CubicO group peptidase (beta-lactamase class C family)
VEPRPDARVDTTAVDAPVSGEGTVPDVEVQDGPSADQASLDFSAVGTLLKQAFADGRIEGDFVLLDIYDQASGALLYSTLEGTGGRTNKVAVASASKWVTSTVLLQLVTEGKLALSDTTAQHLGWTGTKGTITLEHLLGLTSGLEEHTCPYLPWLTLESCVEKIEQTTLEGDPNTIFHYNQAHHQVAGRMAEVVTGKSWETLFSERVVTPLGLDPDTRYYSSPNQQKGTDNPLLAGGLVVSAADYGTILTHLIGAGGVTPLLSPPLLAQQHAERWPAGLTISGLAPIADIHYGLGCWRHCATPETPSSCDQDLLVHSAGLYGFVPFWDKRYGVYGVLGAAEPAGAGRKNAALLYDELRPLIAAALGQ